jgi:bifunctional non-homologous end joining protein LigD
LAHLPNGINASSVILDGELLVLDQHGQPSFEMMQQHAADVAFYIFDVLQVDGHDTIALPYEQRRSLLDGLIEPGTHWTVPAYTVGGGADLLAASQTMALEGIVAKRLGSGYLPGKRSPNWVKIKNRQQVSVVIGGYSPGEGNRASTFGSLLVGRVDQRGALVFAGGVGSGFSQSTLETLTKQFKTLHRSDCPFAVPPPTNYSRDAMWIDPVLSAIVDIAEFTNEGLVRHASFVSLDYNSQP